MCFICARVLCSPNMEVIKDLITRGAISSKKPLRIELLFLSTYFGQSRRQVASMAMCVAGANYQNSCWNDYKGSLDRHNCFYYTLWCSMLKVTTTMRSKNVGAVATILVLLFHFKRVKGLAATRQLQSGAKSAFLSLMFVYTHQRN